MPICVLPLSQQKRHTDLIFVYAKWKDIKVKVEGPGNRSNVKVTKSRNVFLWLLIVDEAGDH